MVLHLGAGSLFSISRSRFGIACTLGILSRLLAWSAVSASQTKFWWPFRFCLAIMLALYIVTNFLHCSRHSFRVWYWKPSLFLPPQKKPSLPRNNPFGHSGESWALPPAENLQLFVLFIEENDDPQAWFTYGQTEPDSHHQYTHTPKRDGWWVGGHRKHFSHWDLVPYLTSFELNCGFINKPEPNDERLLMDGVLLVAIGSLLRVTMFWNSTSNNHVKT
jgi:hypothetical protein